MNDACNPRIVMLPGLGADWRMYQPQVEAGFRVEVPQWLTPEPGESLPDYGRRMAEQVDESEPYYLGGTSFGGMLAQEMAKHLRPKALLLIATCVSSRAIPRFVHWLAPIVRPLPFGAFKYVSALLMGSLLRGEKVPPEAQRLLRQMYVDTDPQFFKWAARALDGWSFRGTLDMPVYHLHGDRDRVLPIHGFVPDHCIEGGGHLINATHVDQINAWLRKRTSG